MLLIYFYMKQLILNLLLRRFGLDLQFGTTDKINGFWFASVEFGLVCLIALGLLIRQTNKQIKQLFNFN